MAPLTDPERSPTAFQERLLERSVSNTVANHCPTVAPDLEGLSPSPEGRGL